MSKLRLPIFTFILGVLFGNATLEWKILVLVPLGICLYMDWDEFNVKYKFGGINK
ncbi:hypothetical protein IGI37_002286 [Enterococcus sp. AZ194]|uniref:hypothetical protein n=1 Tax=Enterococcus sp. AZ194 TaxID=2774629 RepID=UPI003F22B11D